MTETIELTLRTLALLVLVGATIHKLVIMQRNTRWWNGLGRALRLEKRALLALWIWLLFYPFLPSLHHSAYLITLAVLLVIAEVRVSLMMPRIAIVHRDPEETEARQDAREAEQNAESERLAVRRRELDSRHGEQSS